jgi:hypothetical protein
MQSQHRRLPWTGSGLPFTSAMIDFFERLTLLFGIADLSIGSDTGMTAPTPAKMVD